MYLEELVEVVIGSIFAWLLISIATMQIQEVISSLTSKRARDLENAIKNMIDDPGKFDEFYKHPLIKTLIEPDTDFQKTIKKKVADGQKLNVIEWLYKPWAMKKKLPSYIPARNFASAMFDVVIQAGTEESLVKNKIKFLSEKIDSLEAGDKDALRAAVDNIQKLGQMAASTKAGIQFQASVKDALNKQIKMLGKEHAELLPLTDELAILVSVHSDELGKLFQSDDVLEQIRSGAETLGVNHDLARSLRSLMAGAEEYATDAEKAIAVGRKEVENWFDNVMDRMGGWYKRWAQILAFVIGLVIAIIFNVDTIRIAGTLWKTPELRAATSAYIDGYVKQETAKAGFNINEVDLQPISNKLQEISYPVGWAEDKVTGVPGVLSKILGLLITAGAAMLGAPFWFDILKKLVNIRGVGANPAEEPKATANRGNGQSRER